MGAPHLIHSLSHLPHTSKNNNNLSTLTLSSPTLGLGKCEEQRRGQRKKENERCWDFPSPTFFVVGRPNR